MGKIAQDVSGALLIAGGSNVIPYSKKEKKKKGKARPDTTEARMVKKVLKTKLTFQ